MKTRKSISGKGEQEKEVLESTNQEDVVKKVSPPIVRKLRSRVIVSDTEDDSHVKSKTPKSQHKALKENAESSPPDYNGVTKASNKVSRTVCLTTRTPKPSKRLSAVNLFRIIEEKEELNIEDCKGKVKEEASATNDYGEVLSDTSAITCNDNAPIHETVIPTNELVKKEVFTSGGSEECSSDQEAFTTAIKEEAAERKETQEEGTKKNYDVEGEPTESGEDSDSGDNMPEAVSFSSSKNTVSVELSMIAEAIRREKEKRKDLIRKKIEMIRIQKAEKENKRKQKLKLLEACVPERLAEDVVCSLPVKPDIPTVKKSISKDKKRKHEEKEEELEHTVEENKDKIMKFDDYIPITGIEGSTQFGVVPLKVTSRLPKPSSHSAAEFKQKALFGSRIQREPSKNLLIYRQKLSAAGKLPKGYTSSFLKT